MAEAALPRLSACWVSWTDREEADKGGRREGVLTVQPETASSSVTEPGSLP